MVHPFIYGYVLFIRGYYEIHMQGVSPEKLWNRCISSGIYLVNIRQVDDSYYFAVSLKDYQKLQIYSQGLPVQLETIEQHGLPIMIHSCLSHKSYLIGICIFMTLILILSLHIWDITLLDNVKYTDEVILDYLDICGVNCGMIKWKVSCPEIEEKLREHFDELTWVSAKIIGTRLIIQVKENPHPGFSEVHPEKPADIVADEKAKIISIVVKSGIGQVKKGDQVEKGTLLVSGSLPVTGDNDEVIRWHYVSSCATIIGEVNQSYMIEFPQSNNIYTKTSEIKSYMLQFGDKRFYLGGFKLLKKDNKSDRFIKSHTEQLHLFEHFYLPVWFTRISTIQAKPYERYYSNQQKNEIMDAYLLSILQKLEQKGVQIIQNNVKIKNSKSKWQIIVSVVMQRPIGISQDITYAEEIKQPDEYNGNND